MSANILKKRTLSIKKTTFQHLLALFLSLAYGAFIVSSLLLQYSLGSGDIYSYIHYFDEGGNDSSVVVFGVDYVFRIGVFWLTEFFDITTISVLSLMGFVISTIIFYIYTTSFRTKNHLIYLLPLLKQEVYV